MNAPPRAATRAYEDRATPSLPGLRAIAVALILLPPISSGFGAAARQVVDRYTYYGALGARVLLVLSGYLLTEHLMAERARTGSVDLKRFYLRLGIRVFPPFYCYLAVVALLAIPGLIKQSLTGVLSAATYTSNYAPDVGWYVGHTWLLAVQAQWYVLWPVAVAALGTRARWAAWAAVLLCPLFRLWTLVRLNGAYGFDHRLETTADLLAVGCLAAIYAQPFKGQARETPVPPIVLVLILGAINISVTALNHTRVDLLAGRTIAATAVAGVIYLLRHATGSAAARMLESAPLRWLGRISYSLFLWQQVAFVPTGRSDAPGVVVRSVIALALALASYRLTEQPGALRRARLEAPTRGGTPGSRRHSPSGLQEMEGRALP